jgi:hypothetical protein
VAVVLSSRAKTAGLVDVGALSAAEIAAEVADIVGSSRQINAAIHRIGITQAAATRAHTFASSVAAPWATTSRGAPRAEATSFATPSSKLSLPTPPSQGSNTAEAA